MVRPTGLMSGFCFASASTDESPGASGRSRQERVAHKSGSSWGLPSLKCCLSQTCAVDAGFSERTSSNDTNFGREGSGPGPDPRESYRDTDAEASPNGGYSIGSDSDEEQADRLSPRRFDISLQDFKVQCTQSLKNGHFVQDYKIGEMLGQGSFGIVFAARRRNVDGPEGDVAVKLIDKVEMPPEDIERETKIHAMLDHPNILKVHDVIDERFFVCIVTDRFRGGDLVKCLQEGKRRLKPSKIVHIAKQLLEGVGYLHTLAIVHRDVKADNILLEREDLVDPSCRIILADFGFACVCKMGDRLQRRCGTRVYWAPEMWDRNYASKVDVWAVGVTLFGMVEGNFPFRTEFEVKRKGVTCHPMMSPKCLDFLTQLLTKTESRRPTAAQGLEHKWLTVADPAAVGNVNSLISNDDAVEELLTDQEVFRAEHPDNYITQRRLALVGRLGGFYEERSPMSKKFTDTLSLSSCDSAHLTPTATLCKRTFMVKDRKACKMRTFEWWPWSRVEQEILCTKDAAREEQLPRRGEDGDMLGYMNTQLVAQILQEHSIDTTQFSQGGFKTLQRFAAEVDNGAARLMLDASKHKAIVRVVDVVLLRLSQGEGAGKSYLIVTADEQEDGPVRENLNRLPGTKKRPHENVREATQRILMSIPNPQSWDRKIICNFKSKEVFEEDAESLSYPGVRTIYRTEIVSAYTDTRFIAEDEMDMGPSATDQSLGNLPLAHRTSTGTKFFSWMSEEECFALKVRLGAPEERAAVSDLVPAPIGLKVRALGRYLKANSIDPGQFGKGQAKSLQELSTELTSGESSLMVSPQGDLVRLVDVVLLKLVQGESREILVVTKERHEANTTEEVGLNRLPGSKRRPDENHFLAAKRVLSRQLHISEDYVKLDEGEIHVVQESKDSPSYPGLRTVYLKRVISAELVDVTPTAAHQVMTSTSLDLSHPSRQEGAAIGVNISSYAPGWRFDELYPDAYA